METWIAWTPWWLALLLGLALGSFNNVLIHRLPRAESLWRPASRCPVCQRPIRPWENIPLLSWLWLRARCAGCRTPISPRYPLVEAGTALVALAVAWRVPLDASWLVWIPAFSMLVALAMIDVECRRLPNVLTASLAILGLAGVGLHAAGFTGLAGRLPGAVGALWGALAGGGSLWAFAWIGWLIFRREAMGAGDIKLMGAMGLLLGWQLVLLAIFLAALGGSVAGLLLRRRGTEMAFGPWLALGSLLVFLQGDEWIAAYLAWALGV